MAILRSFVICQAELTLRQVPNIALISSFVVREEKEKKDRGGQKERGAVVFCNKDNIYAFPSHCQLKETQTWKSIMERFLKV